jgi:hypothetical protein
VLTAGFDAVALVVLGRFALQKALMRELQGKSLVEVVELLVRLVFQPLTLLLLLLP